MELPHIFQDHPKKPKKTTVKILEKKTLKSMTAGLTEVRTKTQAEIKQKRWEGTS